MWGKKLQGAAILSEFYVSRKTGRYILYKEESFAKTVEAKFF